MDYPLQWTKLTTKEAFDQLIETSKVKPALVFKHRPASDESVQALNQIEAEWSIIPEDLDLFILDVMEEKNLSEMVADFAGVKNAFPQVLLFADGVTMYDESHDMISVKKIKLALKIINRTFKWLETRV